MRRTYYDSLRIFKAMALMSLLSVVQCLHKAEKKAIHGRYTRNIQDYHLTTPSKVNHDGTFKEFTLPHYYNRQVKSHNTSDDAVHYLVDLHGETHHLELTPNHRLMLPALVVESHHGNDLSDIKMRTLASPQCHYTGGVRGRPGSRAVVSACGDGMNGYVETDAGHFYIEPAGGAQPTEDGRHLHVVHRRRDDVERGRPCGVTEDGRKAWEDLYRREYDLSKRATHKPHHKRANHCQSRKRANHKHLHMRADHKQPHKRAMRSSNDYCNKHHYIETLVVADKNLIDFHRSISNDVESYLLTIMNMASDMWHDESTGNLIDIVVVRIILFEKDQEDRYLSVGEPGQRLASFTAWAEKVNPPERHLNHHDAAVLLSKHELGWADGGGGAAAALGVSGIGQMCTAGRSGCLVEDYGLYTGRTVGHQFGHLVGCPHDPETGPCSSPRDRNVFNRVYVMAAGNHVNRATWSVCSRRYITEFLSLGAADCLLNEPENNNYRFVDMPAGTMYDANFQCRSLFGPNAFSFKKGHTLCERLWCKIAPYMTSAVSRHYPPADGTPCATNKWCFDFKCVEMGKRPNGVDGGWSEWSPVSACSRTCGGGVQHRERECNNPPPRDKGRYCVGQRRQHETCATAPCEGGMPYRAAQCAEHDAIRFQGRLHAWQPYRKPGGNPCALACVTEENVMAVLSPQVRDGTPCRDGARDMCVEGACRQVGCDWTIDSDAIEDQCGVCRGDGTQCTRVEDEYNTVDGGSGYQNITVVPKGSRNIHVEQLDANVNFIAVSSAKNAAGKVTFFLNGDFTEQPDNEYRFGKGIGVYSHSETSRCELELKGPLSEEITLYAVLVNGSYPTVVSYTYYKPSADPSYLPKYRWEFVDWSACSVRCGSGSEISDPSCLEANSGKVTPTFCHLSEKPKPRGRVCSRSPCKTHWKVGEWGECEDGKQTRTVVCVEESQHAGEEDIEKQPEACKEGKPPQVRDCVAAPRKRSIADESHYTYGDAPAMNLDRPGALPGWKLLPRPMMGTLWTVPPPRLIKIYNDRPAEAKSFFGHRVGLSNLLKQIHMPDSANFDACGPREHQPKKKYDEDSEADDEDDIDIQHACNKSSKCGGAKGKPHRPKCGGTVATLKKKTKDNCKTMVDELLPDEIVLEVAQVVVPSRGKGKQAVDKTLRLSDQATQELGDKVAVETLDVVNTTVVFGREAAERINALLRPASKKGRHKRRVEKGKRHAFQNKKRLWVTKTKL